MTYTKYRMLEEVHQDGNPLLLTIQGWGEAVLNEYMGTKIWGWIDVYKTSELDSARAAWELIKRFNGHSHIAEEFTVL